MHVKKLISSPLLVVKILGKFSPKAKNHLNCNSW